MKCSFCEHPLRCKTCGQDFQARTREGYLGVFQPDMEVLCPACRSVLVCKECGYVYGDPGEGAEPD